MFFRFETIAVTGRVTGNADGFSCIYARDMGRAAPRAGGLPLGAFRGSEVVRDGTWW